MTLTGLRLRTLYSIGLERAVRALLHLQPLLRQFPIIQWSLVASKVGARTCAPSVTALELALWNPPYYLVNDPLPIFGIVFSHNTLDSAIWLEPVWRHRWHCYARQTLVSVISYQIYRVGSQPRTLSRHNPRLFYNQFMVPNSFTSPNPNSPLHLSHHLRSGQ